MEIRVYTANAEQLKDLELFHALYGHVTAQRREKVDRMRFDKDRRLSLGAGALLEAALIREGVSDLTMTTEGNDKPCLVQSRGIHFNLSHAGTRVMCAVSDAEIGCDVEEIRDIDMEIARRFFCREEYENLMRCPGQEERKHLFFRYWTIKESFMKATGLGFQLPPDQFCICLDRPDAGQKITVRQHVDRRSYTFEEFDGPVGYCFSICSVDKPSSGTKMAEQDFHEVCHVLHT